MFTKKELWKEIRPSLPAWLNEDEREELNSEIGDYIVTTMLDKLGDGVSPVEGGGVFRELSENYANDEKGGNRTANLSLEGDLWSALTFEADAYGVKVGFWEETEAAKAFGHTTGFEGHPTLEGKAPKRKIIPSAKESFISDIQEGIDQIIEEYASAREDSEEAQGS